MNFDTLKDKTILIAEDDFNSRLLLQEYLDDYVLELIFAKDGLQVINSVKENQQIDLVLMDFKLPQISGVEASKRIRKFSAIPVIAQTASILTKETKEQLNTYFDDYLLKPFNQDDLLRTICKYL